MRPVGPKTIEEGQRSIKILSDRVSRSKSFQENGSMRFAVSIEVDQDSPHTLRALASFSPSERSIIIRQMFEKLDDGISAIMAVKAMVKKNVLDRNLRARTKKLKSRKKRGPKKPGTTKS